MAAWGRGHDGGSDDENGGDGGGHPSFQLGLDDSNEHLEELQFSLAHSKDADKDDIAGQIEAMNERARAADYAIEHGLEIDEDPALVLATEDLGLGIQRVDSADILYETKPKKVKILGNYVMGDVLGEGSYAKVKEAVENASAGQQSGGLFLAVNRGKVSEGMNFTDRMARAVFLIGLPFPNRADVKVKLKMVVR